MTDPMLAVDDADLEISFASLAPEIEEPVGPILTLKGVTGPAVGLEVDVPVPLVYDWGIPVHRARVLHFRPILMFSGVMWLGAAGLAIFTAAMWHAPELSAAAATYGLAGAASLLAGSVSR